jgi:hypothetical protein
MSCTVTRHAHARSSSCCVRAFADGWCASGAGCLETCSDAAAAHLFVRCPRQACAVGKYKLTSEAGTVACTGCPAGTTTSAASTHATSAGLACATACASPNFSDLGSGCVSCGTFAESSSGFDAVTDCKCQAGYYGTVTGNASTVTNTCQVTHHAPARSSSCCVRAFADGVSMVPVALKPAAVLSMTCSGDPPRPCPLLVLLLAC